MDPDEAIEAIEAIAHAWDEGSRSCSPTCSGRWSQRAKESGGPPGLARALNPLGRGCLHDDARADVFGRAMRVATTPGAGRCPAPTTAPRLAIKAPRWRFHAGASKGILPHISVGALFHTLGGDFYERQLSDSQDSFSWEAYGLSTFVRASTPDQVRETILKLGWGEWLAGVLSDYSAAYAKGWGDFTTSFVEKITGHPARSVAQFAREVFAPALTR